LEFIMAFEKFSPERLIGWLAKGAAALLIAFVVAGCVVEERPYHDHYHGWHEWR
jgi:hypothetical protein